MKIQKKKGRPSNSPLPLSTPPTSRRSTRRNPNNHSPPPQPEFDGDDDDERKEKKVKLVLRLPQSGENINLEDKQHSREIDSSSGSESDPDSGDREGSAKKRKVNGDDRGSDDGLSDQDKVVIKGTRTSSLHGSPLESGPTTPLPDKKLLVFILDRLQKKDTYGVFSEPVDPNELPDYFEIIDQPMDFGTVRKKLDTGAYKNLEELEVDVRLICSNAMHYNSADTVYYRQARTIQELAKRDFNNLKHEGDNGELQPKVIRRGRPPSSKNQKKSLETTPVDRVGNELSSSATLAKEEDKATGSNSYNLRKGPGSYRVRPTDSFMTSHGSRNGENHSEWSVDWNNEFPASILRADMKYGKKQFTVDEKRRNTYGKFCSMSSGNNSLVLSNSIGSMKRLVPVGLHEALAYARSLARYASNLSPEAWKMASRKIEAVIPSGVRYGPGWVGDKDSPSQTSSSTENQKPSSSNPPTPSSAIAPPRKVVESVRKLNSTTNGVSGMFGYADSSAKPGNSVTANVKAEPGNDLSSSQSPTANHMVPEQAPELIECSGNSLPPPPGLHMHERGAPDLNLRVPGVSPSSSLQIGSPQQPDLALQL